MPAIPASRSVSGYAYQQVTNWLNKHETPLQKTFKQITAEVAYAGVMVFGSLETIARGVYAMFLKGIAQCMDQAAKKEFMKKYVNDAGQSFIVTASVMGAAALSLKDNLLKMNCHVDTTRKIINAEVTIEKVMKFYFKTFPQPLRAMGFPIPN